MPVTGDVVTVSRLLAALAEVDPDTPIVVQTVGTEKLLWISEITLNAMQETYAVDEAVIALPAEHVVLAAGPPIKGAHSDRE